MRRFSEHGGGGGGVKDIEGWVTCKDHGGWVTCKDHGEAFLRVHHNCCSYPPVSAVRLQLSLSFSQCQKLWLAEKLCFPPKTLIVNMLDWGGWSHLIHSSKNLLVNFFFFFTWDTNEVWCPSQCLFQFLEILIPGEKLPVGRKLEMKQMFVIDHGLYSHSSTPPHPRIEKKISWREKKILVNKISL